MSDLVVSDLGHPLAADGRVQVDSQMQAPSPGEVKPSTRPELPRRMSKIQRQEAILKKRPAPAHWRAARPSEPFGRLRRTVFNILCITSFGHAGLEPVWAAIKLEEEGDESVWAEGIRQTTERLNNMLVVVRLYSSCGTRLADVPLGRLTTGHGSRLYDHGTA